MSNKDDDVILLSSHDPDIAPLSNEENFVVLSNSEDSNDDLERNKQPKGKLKWNNFNCHWDH